MRRPAMLVAALVALVAMPACGGGTASAPPPLVHRFEHADQWAKEFDDPARDAWQKPADVASALQIAPGMTVADIGAGTGYFEPYLSRAAGASGVVLAVDIEPDMIRYLRDRAAREHLDNVRPVLATTDDPRLPARGVDRILIVDTWHHVPAHHAYLERLREALAPGGSLTILDFTLDSPRGPPREHRISLDALAKELADAGFTAATLPLSLPYQYAVVARP
jgi:ubiquinone/menaquinone biosynthesis C-methylase UbiE